MPAIVRRVNINVLVCEARTIGFDDVLFDPTDDEIIHAVCEMLDTSWDHLSAGDIDVEIADIILQAGIFESYIYG